MARRTTLNNLVTMLRAEVRDAPNAAFGVQVRESYEALLRRHQEVLWGQYDWPHMRVHVDKALAAGQRYYDPPSDPAMTVDRIERIQYRHGSQWLPLPRGIPQRLYGIQDSDADERSDPPRAWEIYNGAASDQYEIWPIPATNGNADTLEGYLRITGIKNLSALTANTDRADLDDRMIVLFAAAELLMARGAKDAEMKFRMATAHFNRLKANSVNATGTMVMGAGEEGSGVHHSPGHPRWVYDNYGKPHLIR